MARPEHDLPALSARELNEARLTVLRRRVAWFRIAVGAILIFNSAMAYIISAVWQRRALSRPDQSGLGAMVFMGVGGVLVPWLRARRRPPPATLRGLVRRVSII